VKRVNSLAAIRFAGLCVAAVLAIGCGTTQEAATRSTRVADYYPLVVGHSWTFIVTPSPPDQPQQTVTVVGENNGWFEMSVGPPLAARATSVTDGTMDLLRAPLEVGTEWVIVPSAATVLRNKIVAVDAELKTPAGLFRDCVQVQTEQDIRSREGKKGKLIGVWTYAPHIGPVHFVRRVELEGEQPKKDVEYVLVGYKLSESA
jgi:hypothetical protein